MSAETAFREAFIRLQLGVPKNISKGSKVSQNNVAREAGLDPSALKKSRFPDLILEIQEWLARNRKSTNSAHSPHKDSQLQKRDYQKQILDLRMQRDHLASLLVDADSLILKLKSQLKNSVPIDDKVMHISNKTSKSLRD